MILREHELWETRILAPFGGTVTEIFINRGDVLKPLETPVLELVALSYLYVDLVLPVNHILKVGLGHKVSVQVGSEGLGRQGILDGTIMHINPKVDAPSHTFRVKIAFSDSSGKVRPGMLAKVGFGEL
jgi:membrane fusion protein, multidrug efflux system